MSYTKHRQPTPTHPRAPQAPLDPSELEEGQGGAGDADSIRVDGFAQVLAMLRIADPEFRESLLQRIAARDRNLARSLRADLGI